MKSVMLNTVMILISLQGCKRAGYEISNPSGVKCTDLAFVVSRSVVNQYLADTTKDLPVVVSDPSGNLLPSQCDDVDGDGHWDELVFLCDLEAGASDRVLFETSDAQPEFQMRTNVRFGRVVKPFEEVTTDLRMKTNDTKFTAPVYQMEGPAWENDVVAFRNYYDARNGVDIYGKRTGSMVLDSVGVNGRDYHTLADWGMDILKVGNSLGAGAIAIGIGDSLYRVGPCEEGKYRLICEGPVRAMLELTYKKVPAGNRYYDVIHRIAIYAGDPFYRSQVWIHGLKGDEALVTGIVDLHALPADTLAGGDWNIMYTLGNQGFNGEVLGMAVLVPAAGFIRYHEAPSVGSGIVSTHLVSQALREGTAAEYCFAAVWELQDVRVKEEVYFRELLKLAVLKIE